MGTGETAWGRISQNPKALVGAALILAVAIVAAYYGYSSSDKKDVENDPIPVLSEGGRAGVFNPSEPDPSVTRDSTAILRKLSVKAPKPAAEPEPPAKEVETDAAGPEEEAQAPAAPAGLQGREQLLGDIRGLDNPEAWVSGGSTALDRSVEAATQGQAEEGPIESRATRPAPQLAWAGVIRQPRPLDSRQVNALKTPAGKTDRSGRPTARNPALSAASSQNAIGMNTGSGSGAAYAGGQPAGDRQTLAGGGAIPMPGAGVGGVAPAGGGGGGGDAPKYVAQKTRKTINGEAAEVLALAGDYHSTVVKRFVAMEEEDIPPLQSRVDDSKTKLAALKASLDKERANYTGKPLQTLDDSLALADELRTRLEDGGSAIRDILGQSDGRSLGLFSLGNCQKTGVITRSRLVYYQNYGYYWDEYGGYYPGKGQTLYTSAPYYTGCKAECPQQYYWDGGYYECPKITSSQQTYIGPGTYEGQSVLMYRETYSCTADVGLAAVEDHQRLAAGLKKIRGARDTAESFAPDVPKEYAAAAEGLDPAKAARFKQLGAGVRSTLDELARALPSNLRVTAARDASGLRQAAQAGRVKIADWDQHLKDDNLGYPQGPTLIDLHRRMSAAKTHSGEAALLTNTAGATLYDLAGGGDESTQAYVELCKSQELLRSIAPQAPNY
ncbi:MAG: hypothetical protein WC728_13225 [Elusimicrobiota bacterium]